jgi:acetyl esterase/lipase
LSIRDYKAPRVVSNTRRKSLQRIPATMSFQHVDPSLWPLVETFPPIDLGAETLAPFRAALTEMSAMPDPAAHSDVRIEQVAAGGVRCLLYRPLQRNSGSALLHIHGGGYVMGLPEMDAARNIELVRETGCTILSVAYRLAPEHPYPAGLEDCHAALRWLASQLPSWGIPPRRIGVIGESAGGGLAASLAAVARDSSSVAIACQILIYPMLVPPQQSLDTSRPDPRTGHYIWTRASNGYAWGAYLAGGEMTKSTLSGLPPAFLAVGDVDLFVHDNLAHVDGLLTAGVATEAHLYPGAIHGFDRMVDAPVSIRYNRDLVAFIQKHL